MREQGGSITHHSLCSMQSGEKNQYAVTGLSRQEVNKRVTSDLKRKWM